MSDEDGKWIDDLIAYDIATNSGDDKNGCYIATCVYGSYDCPEVWILRRFRDYTLAESRFGRAFIRIYYKVSPIIVKKLGKAVWFHRTGRWLLDRMVKWLRAKGIEDTVYKDRF